MSDDACMRTARRTAYRCAIVCAAVVAAAALLPSAGTAQSPELPYGFHVGEPFPTLAFPALDDGEPTSIADFRGQRLILHVFASW